MMQELEFNHKKIAYRTFGKGTAVVLLHGFGENGNVWNRQIDALQSTCFLIVPDLPGSGNSEPLDGEPSLADFAEVIEVILEKEIPNQKCNLFGHSMGGYITMAFVEKFPGRLNSFGLIHSSAFADTDSKKETRKKGIAFIDINGGYAFLKAIIPDLFSNESKENNPEFVEELLGLTKEITDASLIQYYKAMMQRPDRSDLLKSSKVPVLFLIGKYDNVIPLETSLMQCDLPPVSSVKILDHSGHMGMWEQTAAVNEAFISFFTDFSPPE